MFRRVSLVGVGRRGLFFGGVVWVVVEEEMWIVWEEGEREEGEMCWWEGLEGGGGEFIVWFVVFFF